MSAFLPDWAQELTERLVSACRQDARILGLTLGGSGSTGTIDDFSDLDFVVVCAADKRDEALARADRLAGAAGTVLASFTGEHVGEPRLVIALIGPPLRHIDLKFVTLAELAERVEDGAVIWSRDERVGEVLRTTAPEWPVPRAQWLEDRFWVWAHYTAVKIGRGELFEALDALGFMRAMVIGPLIASAHGRRAQGVRRLEEYAPDLVPELEATVGDHTRAGCLAALRATMRFYVRLRAEGPGPAVPRTAAESAVIAFLAEIG